MSSVTDSYTVYVEIIKALVTSGDKEALEPEIVKKLTNNASLTDAAVLSPLGKELALLMLYDVFELEPGRKAPNIEPEDLEAMKADKCNGVKRAVMTMPAKNRRISDTPLPGPISAEFAFFILANFEIHCQFLEMVLKLCAGRIVDAAMILVDQENIDQRSDGIDTMSSGLERHMAILPPGLRKDVSRLIGENREIYSNACQVSRDITILVGHLENISEAPDPLKKLAIDTLSVTQVRGKENRDFLFKAQLLKFKDRYKVPKNLDSKSLLENVRQLLVRNMTHVLDAGFSHEELKTVTWIVWDHESLASLFTETVDISVAAIPYEILEDFWETCHKYIHKRNFCFNEVFAFE